MTEHNLDVVLSEDLSPVDTLLVVVRPCSCMLLRHHTLAGNILSEEWVCCRSETALVEINVIDRSYGESVRESELCSTCSIECVTLCVACVELVVRERVCICKERAWVCDISLTVVVTHETRSWVVDNVSISVTDIERIDRSNIHECENVCRRVAITFLAEVIKVVVTVRHVTRELQPRLHLIVSLETTSETLVVRSCCDTIVAKVVSRSVECSALCRASSCHGVFLT